MTATDIRILDADAVAEALTYPDLIDALDTAFRGGFTVPVRAHHNLPTASGRDATLLVMPAWSDSGYLGLKTVIVAPDNAERGLPAVQATYQLFDRATGRSLALLDGPTITARRTASASALAARYLAAPGATKLLMVGTGVLARHLPAAHAAVRPITEIKVWGRTMAKAEETAADIRAQGLNVTATDDLKAAVDWADIVSSATLSETPLIEGAWLHPGQHVDLVGAFRPDMREADDVALTRSRVFCDTRAGAMVEAGDLAGPLARGVLREEDIEADLFDLAQGHVPVGRADGDITLFKSTGTAIEDLAAAILAYTRTVG